MKNHLLIAGLLFGLGSLPAAAQMSPSSTDPHQQPGASTPGTPPTFPTDRQEDAKGQQNRKDSDADSQQTDKDRTDRDGKDQDRTDRDRLPQSDRDQQDQTDRQSTDRQGTD